MWLKNTPDFLNTYRVVRVDLFGHGASSKEISPETAFASTPDAIKALIEKEGLQNVILIGHSIAGNILSDCIEEKIEHIKGYVFVDCTFNATRRVVASRNNLADSLLKYGPGNIDGAVEDWYKTMMDMNADEKDNELILSAQKGLDKNWVLNFLKATNVVRKAPHTNLPVLIFESSWLTKDEPERSFHGAFPHATLSHWSVPNHFFFVYNPEKFNRILQEFLAKHFS